TIDNARNILRLLEEDGKRVVDRVVEISYSGRAPKNDPAIFVLALASAAEDADTRSYALEMMPLVVRTGTHLFQFINYCDKLRGWGRALRNSISKWYTDKDLSQLVYQIIKYKSRYGWSHRDVLKKAHPKPKSPQQDFLFRSITRGLDDNGLDLILDGDLTRYYVASTLGTKFNPDNPADVNTVAKLIVQYDLPREVIPTRMLNYPIIWEALLETGMPYTAMLRNLGKMSSVGVTRELSETTKKIVDTLTNTTIIQRARVHPINILAAKVVYSQGAGYRGSNTWSVNQQICDALETAFYESFKYLEPTNKRYMIAIDVSSSMTYENVPGLDFLTADLVSAAMAMAYIKKEDYVTTVAFSHKLIPVHLSKHMSIDSVINELKAIHFGATDCALPMLYAIDNNIPIDVFVIWTDNETWYGDVDPHIALKKYREKMGINAKLVVCGVTATNFTIADPDDP
ncbi:MAG TPA: TROVE domain-containing protein, partial [Fervidobacterium sp.]|nr:TROVE domain-containing protein [Fervidobacterium sp.]